MVPMTLPTFVIGRKSVCRNYPATYIYEDSHDRGLYIYRPKCPQQRPFSHSILQSYNWPGGNARKVFFVS